MGLLNGLLQAASVVGQQFVKNQIKQFSDWCLQDAANQYSPKILDSYYSTSRIENILKEPNVYDDEESHHTRQYYRDSYYFAGTSWGQIFTFMPNGNLGKIALVCDGDADIYSNVCNLLGTSCSIVIISDDEYVAYLCDDFNSNEEWIDAINELEQSGLQKGCLRFSVVDNWVLEYFSKMNNFPQDYNNFIQMLPVNSRLITLQISGDDLILHFESASMLKTSQF